MKHNTRMVAYAAVVAALYAALCYALAPVAFGPVQFRVSEALTLLPLFMPAAVPGVFIGCILGNLTSPMFLLDVVFGSLATLLAALGTRAVGKYIHSPVMQMILGPIPPIVCNTFIVGGMLTYTFAGTADAAPFAVFAGQILLSEAIVCYCIGVPLALVLKRVLHGHACTQELRK